jgi:Protein of unknown function (DUF998)
MADRLATTTHVLPTRSMQPVSSRTRGLMWCGAAAGPLYVIVGLTEALTRRGFDLAHQDLSLLSNGPLGWIHISLFLATGLLVILGAAGLHIALRGSARPTGAPVPIGVFGAGLIGAGAFVADPMGGFPPGTPSGMPGHVTLHGTGHFVAAAVGFLGLVVACAVFARHFFGTRERGWAIYSALTGVAFLGAFVGIASGSTSAPVVIGFWTGVILAFTWLSLLCLRFRRGNVQP